MITTTTGTITSTAGGNFTANGANATGALGAGGAGAPPGPNGSAATAGSAGTLGTVSDASDDIRYEEDQDDTDSKPWRKKKRHAIASADQHNSATTSAPNFVPTGNIDENEANQFKAIAFVQSVLAIDDRQLPARNAFFAPDDHNVVVHSGGADIHIAKGAAAFVVNRSSDIAVMALHESGKNIRINIIGNEYTLHAGEMLVISKSQDGDLSSLNPVDGLAVRNVNEHKISNGSRAFVCDFSIISAMSRLGTLRSLKNSADNADRVAFNNMLKNAAALHQVTAYRGPYRP